LAGLRGRAAPLRSAFSHQLRCLECGGAVATNYEAGETATEGFLTCDRGHTAPLIAGLPRFLPANTAKVLIGTHGDYFLRYPSVRPTGGDPTAPESLRTLGAFGDEWQRFPEIHAVHRQIFDWYFDGPEPVRWKGLRVLDAGCGMGRWLHFARQRGAEIVGMDVSAAIDVAAARDGDGADFVQADLRFPPFAPESFELVYSLGVVHHLEDPLVGVRALARLVRPGGELRLYVYRSLDDEPLWRRLLLNAVTALRRVTTRLPYAAVHSVAWLVAVTASVLFLWPRRLLRRFALGDRLTRGLPLVHYADVPFRMLVAEQFDRLVAPIEGRFRRDEVEAWIREVGLEVIAVLPGLGWRVIARRRPS
jgi:SAM-dependent methyltransferase